MLEKEKPFVIVIGNLTLGGTGKTPFVKFLAQYFSQSNLEVCILTRGYKGRLKGPHLVIDIDSSKDVGDEAKLLFDTVKCPIIVSKSRKKGYEFIKDRMSVDIILTDDGLQNYKLPRHKEIVLVNAKRQFGNELMLPCGPLREPISRIKKADLVIEVGHDKQDMKQGKNLVNFRKSGIKTLYNYFNKIEENVNLDQSTELHAVCAIGDPNKFFDLLRKEGYTIIPHSYSDHQYLKKKELILDMYKPTVITEKDAIKLNKAEFTKNDKIYVVEVELETNDTLLHSIHLLKESLVC